MKYILTLITLAQSFYLNAQNDSAIFDSNFKLKNGVYSSYVEVLANDPKYPDYIVKSQSDDLFGNLSIKFYGPLMDEQDIKDDIFAFVQEGVITLKYDSTNIFMSYKANRYKQFYKLILKGAISTFFIETISKDFNYYNNTYAKTAVNDKLFFLDLKTGHIDRLKPSKIDTILKRDKELYATYSKLSESRKKKTLYSFILKYNLRNPVYIEIQ